MANATVRIKACLFVLWVGNWNKWYLSEKDLGEASNKQHNISQFPGRKHYCREHLEKPKWGQCRGNFHLPICGALLQANHLLLVADRNSL